MSSKTATPTDVELEDTIRIIRRYRSKKDNQWTWEDLAADACRPLHPSVFRPIGAKIRRWHPVWRGWDEFNDQKTQNLAELIAKEHDRLRTRLASDPALLLSEVDAKSTAPIRVLGIVSHNYNEKNRFDLYDYSAEFSEINRICDEKGCDTILYALHTWDLRSPQSLSHEALFAGLKNVQTVILETGEMFRPGADPRGHDQTVEIWMRGRPGPYKAWQWFAQSTAEERFIRLGVPY